MRLRVLALATVLLAGVAPAALAQGARTAPAPPAPASAAVAVPRLEFTRRTLPNGLTLLAHRDASTPNVAVQVWYDVGSKDDPQGRSGFAHLFEHLMFKATRNMPSETFDRLTEDVGGYNNAFTADDVTAYFSVVTANHLERILWAEAERMSNLVVDEANFISERDVVKEEFRQRYVASPYGALLLALTENSFSEHPYRRPGIGNIAELTAATLEDVRAFHAVYYRPDNATVIVAGNFDPAQLDRWVDAYFGRLQRPAGAIPRVTTTEPERRGPREVAVFAPNVPLPAVVASFPGVRADSPDAAALDVLEAVLAKGESSRLYRSLVYDKQVAASAQVFNEQNAQAGFFAPMAVAAGGRTLAEVEAALLAEIARVREGGITAAELEEAKTELLADSLRGRETAEGRAMALGWAVVNARDPADADRALQRLQAVTAADVQRVARTYLRDDRRVLIRYQDEAKRPANAPRPPEPAPPKTAELTRTVTTTPMQPAPEAERQRPPEPGAPRPLTVPTPVERTLANGLRVIVAPAGRLPLTAVRLQLRSGAGADPAGRPGVAAMTAGLLTQGTRTRSAEAVAREVERLGADLSAAAGWDGTAVSLNVLQSKLDAGLAVMADVVLNPALAPEELERQRAQALDGLRVAMSQPGGLAGLLTPVVAFGAGPYGHPQGGTPESLAAMTAADLRRFHAERFTPANATLVFSGATPAEEAFAIAEKHFGGWRSGAAPARAAPRAAGAPPTQTVIVDLPGAGQAAVTAVRPSVSRTDPAFIPTRVAGAVLGGGYSARLNQEIRIRRGLSYGAFGGLSARREGGVLTASTQTKNESAAEVAALIKTELRELATAELPQAELEARKSTLIGEFGRSVETVDGLASELGALTVFGLPTSELAGYAPAVAAVTAEQAKAAAARNLSPDRASLVVVGDAKVFAEALKAQQPGAVVIPAAEVDLDGPSLRRPATAPVSR